MKCSNCGAEFYETDKKCQRCGALPNPKDKGGIGFLILGAIIVLLSLYGLTMNARNSMAPIFSAAPFVVEIGAYFLLRFNKMRNAASSLGKGGWIGFIIIVIIAIARYFILS